MADQTQDKQHGAGEPELTPLGRVVDFVRVVGPAHPRSRCRSGGRGAVPAAATSGWSTSPASPPSSSCRPPSPASGCSPTRPGVVIGAMLVAPLMTPILAAAAATVRADNRELRRCRRHHHARHGAGHRSSATSSVWLAGDADLGHRRPAGRAGGPHLPRVCSTSASPSAPARPPGYIVPRRSAVSALPGVGIAVALVPPLATVGITWELGRSTDALNALLLFLTNLAAIVFSASIMLFAGRIPAPRPGLAPHAGHATCSSPSAPSPRWPSPSPSTRGPRSRTAVSTWSWRRWSPTGTRRPRS